MLRASGIRPRGSSSAKVFESLDVNADGVLERSEFLLLQEMKARLEEAWVMEVESSAALPSSSRSSSSSSTSLPTAQFKNAAAERLASERLAIFDSVADSTNVSTRVAAFASYALPALDLVPQSWTMTATGGLQDFFATTAATAGSTVSSHSVHGLEQALGSAAALYHALPFSGLIAYLIVSNLAGTISQPRLARFSARHAIILDILASFAIPIIESSGSQYAPLARPAFAFVVAASAIAAAFGMSANFVPITGTLTKKFTDDYDEKIRLFVATSADQDSDDTTSKRL